MLTGPDTPVTLDTFPLDTQTSIWGFLWGRIIIWGVVKAASLRPAVSFNIYRKPGNEIEEGSETKQTLDRACTTAPRCQTPGGENSSVLRNKRIPLLFKDPERKRATLSWSQVINLTEVKSPSVSQGGWKTVNTFLWSVQIYLTAFVNSQDAITVYAWCICLFDQEEPLWCERRIWTRTVSTVCIKGPEVRSVLDDRTLGREWGSRAWENEKSTQRLSPCSWAAQDSCSLGNPGRSPSAGWGWCCVESELTFWLCGFQSCSLSEMKKTCNMHPGCV